MKFSDNNRMRHTGSAKKTSDPDRSTENNCNDSLHRRNPSSKDCIRVLVIDDDELVADILGNILDRLGYIVSTETSSVKALEHFTSQPDKYDLIFSDIMMPDLTGDKLARKILEIRSDIPIILCTGFSDIVDFEKARSIGAYALIQKPFDRTEIVQIIRKALNNDAES